MKKVSEGAGHEANAAQVSDGTQENKNVCPTCGGPLRFGSRDPCEGDYYWCTFCGEGPILFPLYHQMPKPAPLHNTYDQLEFAIKEKGYWTPADERRQAEGAKMEIPAVIDADGRQAAAEARIRGRAA